MKPAADHGGAFFEAIGVDLTALKRADGIVSADVLDAWFDPAPGVLELLREHLPFLLRTSPPNHAEGFVAEIAARRGLPVESILPGAGSSSLLFHCLPRLLPESVRAVVLSPMYSEYQHIIQTLLEGEAIPHDLHEANGFRIDGGRLLHQVLSSRPHALLLVNPNNPTGVLWPKAQLLGLLDRAPADMLAVVDETYIEYADASESIEAEAARRPNLLLVKSMSKVYALSGVRAAYAVTHPSRAAQLRRWLPPWPVGLLAQAAAMEALRDPGYYATRYAETRRLREEIAAELSVNAGVRVYSSHSNFLLLETSRAAALAQHLRLAGIYVREFPSGPLAGRFLRIAVKSETQNRLISAGMREFR